MIVVDPSAVVAVLFGEPATARLLARLDAEPARLMSVASYLETGTMLAGRRLNKPLQAIAELDLFLSETDIRLASVDAKQARIALEARIRFGRGMGQGGVLNFGDTFSYALAMVNEAPLLFTGDDFRTTDVIVAL